MNRCASLLSTLQITRVPPHTYVWLSYERQVSGQRSPFAFESSFGACTAYKLGRTSQRLSLSLSLSFLGCWCFRRLVDCVQVLDTDSEVVTGGDPELSLQETPEGPCWVKV